MRQWPTPGSIISVPAYVLLRHKGIVSDRWYGGKPMVISASARVGHGAEEPWDVFTSGQQWAYEGYPGSLQPWEVLQRARALLTKAYDLFAWNCDTFAYASHGIAKVSPQVVMACALAASAVALALAR